MGAFAIIRTPAFDLPTEKEYENPGGKFLLQKIERAFASAAKPPSKP